MRLGNFFLDLRNKICSIPGIKGDCLTVQLHISSYWIVLLANSNICDGAWTSILQARGAVPSHHQGQERKTGNGLIDFKIQGYLNIDYN